MNPSWHSRNGPEELRKRGQRNVPKPPMLTLQRACEQRIHMRLTRWNDRKPIFINWFTDKFQVFTADPQFHVRFQQHQPAADGIMRWIRPDLFEFQNEQLGEVLMWIAATGGYRKCLPAG